MHRNVSVILEDPRPWNGKTTTVSGTDLGRGLIDILGQFK